MNWITRAGSSDRSQQVGKIGTARTCESDSGRGKLGVVLKMNKLVGLSLLLLCTNLLAAPRHDEWEDIRYVLLVWSKALHEGDAEAMATVLHKDFPDREGYLAGLAAGAPKRISLKSARFERTGDSVKVSDVVVYTGLLEFVWSHTFTFIHDAEGWKIRSIEVNWGEVPQEYVQSAHLDQEVLRPVHVSIKDERTGNPVASRVSVRNETGQSFPPQGHMRNISTAWREDLGGNVVVDGKTFAYVDPQFILPLPEGKYEMEVVRGMEYEPQTLRFAVSAEKVPELEVRLRRWTEMAAHGWYSGDTHVHFLDPQSALLETAGEDLHVVNILATKWADLITSVEHFTGRPSPVSTPEHLVYVNEESRHTFLGHTVLLNLKELVYPLSWGGPPEGVPRGWDYPAMAHQVDKAHRQGGLVSWAHFPNPSGELAVDIALGKLDAIDLFTFDNSLSEDPVFPGTLPAARTWYRFLNCGFRLPALGGTDKMSNSQIVGSVRSYVKVNDGFTYDNWIAGIRAGRTFTTTGPMLYLTVNGKGLGETISARKGEKVTVRADVHSLIPVDRIEIVQDGNIVAVEENPRRLHDLTLPAAVVVTESSWLAARSYSSKKLPYQSIAYVKGIPLMAHTSPIYVEVNGKPSRSPRDAAYFAEWCDRAIEWAKTKANYQTEAQRVEVVSIFEQAKSVYARQVAQQD
jgi:hypothetical protein